MKTAYATSILEAKASVKLLVNKRKEYKVERVFETLHDLGVSLTSEEQEIVIHFVLALDFVDQIDDSGYVPDIYERSLNYISSESDFLPLCLPPNVIETFDILKKGINKRGLKEDLIRHSRSLFSKRSQRNNTLSSYEYVRFSLEEGGLYAQVAFLFLPREKMSQSSLELIRVGNFIVRIYDNLVDLKEDYQKGQIAFRPNLKVQLGLRLALIILTFRAFRLYPKKKGAFALAKKYLKRSLQRQANT